MQSKEYAAETVRNEFKEGRFYIQIRANKRKKVFKTHNKKLLIHDTF
jgi:hypothetical protein